MKRVLLITSCIVLLILATSAQTSSAATSFEVATVKLAAPNESGAKMPFLTGPVEELMRFNGGPGSKTPGRIDYTGVTLKMLLKQAYDLQPEQISGPSWLDKERYDIVAKLAPETNVEQLRLMLQNLLTERFQIVLHRETKTLPVYFLLIGKSGPKLGPPETVPVYENDEDRKAAMQKKASDILEAMVRNGNASNNRFFHLPSATTAKFAEKLSSHLDHPVKDETHLDGLYAFTLRWAPDSAKPRDDASPGPSIFVAVEEQLGLKLQRGNQQLDLLVIDKAEKIPIPN